jgi:electron transfer flavoprotein alpha subunit
MKKLIINQKLVTKEIAEDLIKICPFNSFDYVDGVLYINSACRNCGQCVKKGPLGVCVFEEETLVKQINKSLWNGIGVFIEQTAGVIHPVSFELIGKARELALLTHQLVKAIYIGPPSDKNKDEILSYGVDELYIYSHVTLNNFNVESYTFILESWINDTSPSTILYGGTSIGRSLAPRVAARMKTGLTADCTSLSIKPNTDLIQTRPAFGGNIMAQIITPNHRPQMATVRYKIFKTPEKVEPFGKVIYIEVTPSFLDSSVESISSVKTAIKKDICDAEVIIACGRPFKTHESLEQVYELASLLNASVASSRPLIENSVMDSKHQIGLSGRTVSPKLIITLGISGSVQFIAGMKGSDMIISINDDPLAPIFDISHVGIVGDVFKIVPMLIEKIKTNQPL